MAIVVDWDVRKRGWTGTVGAVRGDCCGDVEARVVDEGEAHAPDSTWGYGQRTSDEGESDVN